MTLIGAWLKPDAALVWADTEFYLNPDLARPGELPGQPLGHTQKIFTNQSAGFAAAAAGNGIDNKCVAAATEFAATFDEFVPGLQNLLNDQSCKGTYIAAGWSRRIGRFLSVLFEPPTFRPQYSANGFARPHVRALDALFLAEPSDIVGIAQAQMAMVRHHLPLAGEGWLTVAQVRRDSVDATTFDLATGQPATSGNLLDIGPPNLYARRCG